MNTFAMPMRWPTIVGITLFTGTCIWLFAEALAGRYPESAQSIALGPAMMLYGCGVFAVVFPMFLVLRLLGFPRIEVGNGLAVLDFRLWRVKVDLARYGSGWPGTVKGGGQEQASIFFFTLEHEAALRQTDQYRRPDQFTADYTFPVSAVVGKNMELLAQVSDAINRERTKLDLRVTLSPDAAAALSQTAKASRPGRAISVAFVGAFVLVFDLVAKQRDLTIPFIIYVSCLGLLVAFFIWAHTVKPAWYKPIQLILDFLDPHFWWIAGVIAVVVLGLFVVFVL